VVTFVKSVTFDCRDALALARFWAHTPGSSVDEGSTHDKAFVEATGWGGPMLWFRRVPTRALPAQFASRSPTYSTAPNGSAGFSTRKPVNAVFGRSP
jgi:Glyoxalase-like domain